MSILGVLGGIGSALGIIGQGVSLFSDGKKGSTLSTAGTGISNAASTLSGISAQQAGITGASEQSALSREVFDYQKNLQEKIFQREDDAVQRRVRDLESAGLSRTLAAGSAAGAGQAIKVDTPQSESMLKAQALTQGIQNMLSISQAKANIALTEAQAKKTSAEAGMVGHDLEWYEGAGLPSGTHTGVPFLISSIASMFGISSSQASAFVKNVFSKIAEKLGISVDNILVSVRPNLVDKAVNEISDKMSDIKYSFENSHKDSPLKVIGTRLFSFEGFSDQDIENVIEKVFTPLVSSSVNSFFNSKLKELRKKPSGNGGRAW